MDPVQPADLLNAYLDGELGPNDRQAVEAALSTSPELADELAELNAVRAQLRDLPVVEAPSGYFDAMLERGTADPDVELPNNVASLSTARERRSMRSRVSSAVAVAAVFALVLGFGSGIAAIERVPALDEFASRHAEASAAMPASGDLGDLGDLGDMATGGYDAVDMDEAAEMGPAGNAMKMMGAYKNDDEVLQMIYSDGESVISVFRQPGYVEPGDMPPCETKKMGGNDAWHLVDDRTDILVIDRDGVTYTMVGSPEAGPTIEQLAADLPATSGGMMNRVQSVSKAILDKVGM